MNIKNENKIGEMKLVWAQMRYCVYWPARIVEAPPVMGRTPDHQTCVLFFGTKEFGFVNLDKIADYRANREKYVKKGRGISFKNAVKEMDQYISDPKKFKSNAFAKPVAKKITIKSERDIEQQLDIKQETGTATATDSRQNQLRTRQNASMSESTPAQEKQKLLHAFASLKTENQKLTFDLKKKSEECAKLHSDMEALKKQFESVKAVVSKVEKKIIEHEQKNKELAHENRMLSARTKQLQNEITKEKQRNENTIEKDKSDLFEVEKLIDDKMIGKVRYFLVRWKGYAPCDDTWEREKNLKCASILKKYLEAKNKH